MGNTIPNKANTIVIIVYNVPKEEMTEFWLVIVSVAWLILSSNIFSFKLFCAEIKESTFLFITSISTFSLFIGDFICEKKQVEIDIKKIVMFVLS